jgi:hypothetical protein
METFGRCVLDLNAMLIIGAAALIKLPGVSVGLLSVPDAECPRHDGQTNTGILWSDPAYLAAVAAVSPDGKIRNMKVETFSPGLPIRPSPF